MARRMDEGEAPGSNVTNEAIAQFAIETGQAQRDIDEATGRKRAVLKRAKAAGVDTKMLLAALALKKRDPDEVRTEQRNLIRYAGIIAPHLPMTQASLFDGLDTAPLADRADAQLSEWDAEERGYNAGLNGGSMDDCPWDAGTPYFVAFQGGYIRGQRVIAERMGENAKQASGGRRKRRGGKAAAAGDDLEHDERQVDLEDAIS